LPRALPTVVVEAGTSFGWHRFVGPDAAFVTLERFGASAPAPRLFAEFGFTPEHVAARAQEVVAARRG
jgi:transketolase